MTSSTELRNELERLDAELADVATSAVAASGARQAERERLETELRGAERREAVRAARDRLVADAADATRRAAAAREGAAAAERKAEELDGQTRALEHRAATLRDRAATASALAETLTDDGRDDEAIAARHEARELGEQAENVLSRVAAGTKSAVDARSTVAGLLEAADRLDAAATRLNWQVLVDPLRLAGDAPPPNPFLMSDPHRAALSYRSAHRIPDDPE